MVVHNNTHKTIIGYMLHVQDAQGRGQMPIELPFLGMRRGPTSTGAPGHLKIVPGDQFQLRNVWAMTQIRRADGGMAGPYTRATLMAVLFEDGEVTGAPQQATYLFNAATGQVTAEREIDKQLLDAGPSHLDAVWPAIEDIAFGGTKFPDQSIHYNTFAEMYAKSLIYIRRLQNDGAVFAEARKSAAFPTPWRKP
jgi:hypothetical protein